MAVLVNEEGCVFDQIELKNLKKIKDWAKGRGGCYTLDVDSVYNIMNSIDESIQFKIKNNRFYKC